MFPFTSATDCKTKARKLCDPAVVRAPAACKRALRLLFYTGPCSVMLSCRPSNTRLRSQSAASVDSDPECKLGQKCGSGLFGADTPPADPMYCDMKGYFEARVAMVVDEVQTYLRAKKRATNIKLARSTGAYSHIYERFGYAATEECGRDAALMYKLVVDDTLCDAVRPRNLCTARRAALFN